MVELHWVGLLPTVLLRLVILETCFTSSQLPDQPHPPTPRYGLLHCDLLPGSLLPLLLSWSTVWRLINTFEKTGTKHMQRRAKRNTIIISVKHKPDSQTKVKTWTSWEYNLEMSFEMFQYIQTTLTPPINFLKFFLIQDSFYFHSSSDQNKKCAPSKVSSHKIGPNWPIRQAKTIVTNWSSNMKWCWFPHK